MTDLAGFDALELGQTGGTATTYERALLRVTGRFDSKAVDDGNNDRTAKVTLHQATLITGSTTQGHIGQLVPDGECLLVVARKDDNSTMPLMVDQKANEVQVSAKLKLAVLRSYNDTKLDLYNKVGDRLIQFTNTNVADSEYEKYEDALSTRLSVKQEEDNGNVYIKFDVKKSHLAYGWIEYPDGAPDSTTDTVTKRKILHLVYDKENEHEVRTQYAAGYIVALPKDKVNEAEAANYTVIDTEFEKNGTFSAAVNALNPVKVECTINNSAAGSKGAHEATATVEITDLDPENNWYVLHMMCANGDSLTTVLDVDAPQKVEGDVKIKAEYDSASESYIYELHLSDKDYPDKTKLPTTKPGDADADDYRLTYTANGITSAFWSVGALSGTGTTAADTEAVKQKNAISAQPETNGLYSTASVVLLADGVSAVPGGASAKVTVTVPKEIAEAHKTDAIWVYAKDAANNTVKIPIPLNANIIDVTVPMEANVIAVKKTEIGADRELLAPELKVINNGTNKIEVQISGFQTTQTQNNLNLVVKEKTAVFQADEIALFLKEAGTTTFKETNVKEVNTTPLTIGTLNASGQAGDTASYTFDAGYHVNNINVPDGFIRNTLSYHFRIAEGN